MLLISGTIIPSGGNIAVIELLATESSSTNNFRPIALIAALNAFAIFACLATIFSIPSSFIISKATFNPQIRLTAGVNAVELSLTDFLFVVQLK